MISKKKVNTTSIQNVVNQAFILFGTGCDPEAMQDLNLNANGNNNLAPAIFSGTNVQFDFPCINNQFNTGFFYTFLTSQVINLAKTQTMAIFGFIACPPAFATVTVDEIAIQESIKRMYYNFNPECSITAQDTLIDFNISGSYNYDSSATPNQIMASFGGCQVTEENQDEAALQIQAIIDTSTTVTTSWLAWVFVIIIILVILFIIVGIIVGIVMSRKPIGKMPTVEFPDDSTYAGDFLIEKAMYNS